MISEWTHTEDDREIQDTLDVLSFLDFCETIIEEIRTQGKSNQVDIEESRPHQLWQAAIETFSEWHSSVEKHLQKLVEEILTNKQGELISSWPWEYPNNIKESNKAGEWTSTNTFLNLMTCMNHVYIDQVWWYLEEMHISFAYRSEFERRIKELSEELQTIIFSKVWNKGKDTLWECMTGTTKQAK